MSTVSVESVVVGLSGARVGASGLGRVRIRVRVWVMVEEEVVEVVLIIVGGCRETFVGSETVEPVGTGLAGQKSDSQSQIELSNSTERQRPSDDSNNGGKEDR
nr:hypothetical protein CFP56_41582 [Quercus suber]